MKDKQIEALTWTFVWFIFLLVLIIFPSIFSDSLAYIIALIPLFMLIKTAYCYVRGDFD